MQLNKTLILASVFSLDLLVFINLQDTLNVHIYMLDIHLRGHQNSKLSNVYNCPAGSS